MGCSDPLLLLPSLALPVPQCLRAYLSSQSACLPICGLDAGPYENKAHATGLGTGANTGYSSGLANTGAQGAGAGWVRRSLQRWQSRGCCCLQLPWCLQLLLQLLTLALCSLDRRKLCGLLGAS